MKKGLHYSIAVVFSFSLLSCMKDVATPPAIEPGALVMTVNGTTWNAANASAEIIPRDIIQVKGINSNGEQITLQVENPMGPGTYGMMPSNTALNATKAFILYNSDQGYRSVSGTIAITEIDSLAKTVSGTFNAVEQNFPTPGIWVPKNATITSGRFSKISYFAPSGGLANSLTAVVSGASQSASTSKGDVVDGSMANHFLTVNTLASSRSFVLLMNPPSVGVHTLDQENYTGIYYPDLTLSTNYFLSVSGTLTVTRYDTIQFRVEGSFDFSGSDYYGSTPIPITGTFGLTYH